MSRGPRSIHRLGQGIVLVVERTCTTWTQPDFERCLSRLPLDDRSRLRGFVDRRAAGESLQGRLLMQDFHHAWSAAGGIVGSGIRRDRRGKPYIGGCGGKAPAINLSHGGNLVVLAVAAHGRIGVDVEPCRPMRPALVAACCRPRERAWIDGAATERGRRLRFARLWTLKESLMKACGDGLMIDPCDVEFEMSSAPRLVRSPCGTDWAFFCSMSGEETPLSVCHSGSCIVRGQPSREASRSSRRRPHRYVTRCSTFMGMMMIHHAATSAVGHKGVSKAAA